MNKSRIELKKLTQENASQFIELVNDDELIKKYLIDEDIQDQNSYNEFLKEKERYGSVIKGIFLRDGSLIGMIITESAFTPKGVVEASFCIGEKFRKKGYAKEALAQTIKDLQYKDCNKLIFQIDKDNESSKGLINKGLHASCENQYEEDEIYSIPLIDRDKACLIEQDLGEAICTFHDIDEKVKREKYVREYTLEFCQKNAIEPRAALRVVENVLSKKRNKIVFKYGYYDKLEDIVFPKEKESKQEKMTSKTAKKSKDVEIEER